MTKIYVNMWRHWATESEHNRIQHFKFWKLMPFSTPTGQNFVNTKPFISTKFFSKVILLCTKNVFLRDVRANKFPSFNIIKIVLNIEYDSMW